MAYRVAMIWSGSLDNLMERIGDLGRLISAVVSMPQKPVVQASERIVGQRSAHLTPSEEAVLEIFNLAPRVYSYSEVDSQLSQRGYKVGTGSAVLSTLVQKGKLIRVSRGMYQLA